MADADDDAPQSPRSAGAPPSEDPFDDEEPVPEEEDGEDLIPQDDNVLPMGEYQPMPHLDQYAGSGLASQSESMDYSVEQQARRAAERALAERDRAEGAGRGRATGRRRPAALAGDSDSEEPSRGRRRRRRTGDQIADGVLDDDLEEDPDGDDLNLEEFSCTLREWISQGKVERQVKKRFAQFLQSYQVPRTSEYVYTSRITAMIEGNRQSLEVSYLHLSYFSAILAIWVADCPALMLPLFHAAAKKRVFEMFPHYEAIQKDIFVRITDLPIVDRIRDIRQSHLNALIKIVGVVTRRTGVFPKLESVKFNCTKCSFIIGPLVQSSESELKVGSCPQCQSKGPFSVNVEHTLYHNFQKITLQESPGSVPAGRLPRSKEVVLEHDLIDCARPGEEVEVTGIYTNAFDMSLNTSAGFPVFATVVEANAVARRGEGANSSRLTDDDKAEVLRLARDPAIGKRIVRSIAPSIHGHEDIKLALALAMFGGQEKHVKGKARLRGDINVLLMGDPGVAKSQFLKYVEKTAARAVYTTGKGASAVGLTAGVHRDPVTREWTLEGGALVLADRGTCLIDEFDKMNDQDRVSIHEAMEQQSISISKAGIVTTLQARCSVVAAANPIGGRYDSSKTFSDNVELTDPILSRFDILLVVKDVVDPVLDERLALFVVRSHDRAHPAKAGTAEAAAPIAEGSGGAEDGMLSQEMLRKYISYAKAHCRPKLHQADLGKIQRVYADLRRESVTREGMPVAVRHIESIVRMSEAHACMHMRDYVNDEDVNVAVAVMLRSFIATQKAAVQKPLQKKFAKYTNYQRDYNALLMDALRALLRDVLAYENVMGIAADAASPVLIPARSLEEKAKMYGILDLQPFFDSALFAANNFALRAEDGMISHPR